MLAFYGKKSIRFNICYINQSIIFGKANTETINISVDLYFSFTLWFMSVYTWDEYFLNQYQFPHKRFTTFENAFNNKTASNYFCMPIMLLILLLCMVFFKQTNNQI